MKKKIATSQYYTNTGTYTSLSHHNLKYPNLKPFFKILLKNELPKHWQDSVNTSENITIKANINKTI